LIGEREPVLSQLYGEGDYQIRLVNINTQQCEIGTGLKYEIPQYRSEVNRVICRGGSVSFNNRVNEEEGIYEHNLLSVDGCDSIVTLILTMEEIDPDTVTVQKLPAVPYSFGSSVFQSEGVYNVEFTSTGGCDSTVVLVLDDLDIYIPNIFSPNGDNSNDVFEIVTSDEDFSTKEMSIYNRWGNLLYKGNSWDGSFNNSAVPAGVYVCRVKLVDIEGQFYLHTSTITLIK